MEESQSTNQYKNLAESALRLLQFEAKVRSLKTVAELKAHMATAPRELASFQQGFVWQRHYLSGKMAITQISDLSQVEEQSPLIIELKKWLNKQSLDQNQTLDLFENTGNQFEHYPFRYLMWLPITVKNKVEAGLLYARHDKPFNQQEQMLLERICATYQHAWLALNKHQRLSWGLPISRYWLWLIPVLVIAVGFIPVHLNVMAPVTVIAKNPARLTAPMDGVIKHILVLPNSAVQTGQSLIQFEDLELRNEAILAQEQLKVAKAKYHQTNALAFRQRQAIHDLPIQQAEFQLASSHYKYAKERLAHSLIKSPTQGIAIYTDKQDWEGRAVQVGEQIMEVANPKHIQYQIKLSSGNAIPLHIGQSVQVYLESSPLGGIPAKLTSYSYTAEQENGMSFYKLIAQPIDTQYTPRIGAQGSARINARRVFLWYQLLHRPMNTARQWLGV